MNVHCRRVPWHLLMVGSNRVGLTQPRNKIIHASIDRFIRPGGLSQYLDIRVLADVDENQPLVLIGFAPDSPARRGPRDGKTLVGANNLHGAGIIGLLRPNLFAKLVENLFARNAEQRDAGENHTQENAEDGITGSGYPIAMTSNAG